MKKELAIGVDNFREIQELGNYYIDKSLFISDLPYKSSRVTLITRPRRFGKTLNMSMVAEFFDITKDSKNIYRNLKIMKTEHVSQINTRPVISLSFKDCKDSRAKVLNSLREILCTVYFKYSPLAEKCTGSESLFFKQSFNNLIKEDTDFILTYNALSALCAVLYSYYKIKPILLLDEYDTPLNTAYSLGDEELKKIFSGLYSTTLKGNPYVGMCLLTGIQRVAKENIFSGLNNIVVYTVNNTKYSEYFGFTEEETEKLLNYYDLELSDEVNSMYDGYNFGGKSIYNPWSILNYVESRELLPYWVNTGSNDLIKSALREASKDFKHDFEKLFIVREVDVEIDAHTAYSQIKGSRTLWGLLLNAGYVTTVAATGDKYKIRIPNNEVRKEFRNIISDYMEADNSKYFF